MDVEPGSDPYPADAQWAEPDVDDAARKMREAFEHREDAARRGARGAELLREKYAPAVSGHAMRLRLEVLNSQVPAGPQRSEVGDWLIGRAEYDRARIDLRTHFPGARSRLGRLGALARSGVRRATLPYTWHQDRINRELADAVVRSDQRVADALAALDQRSAAYEAQLALELRGNEERIAALQERLASEQAARERLAGDVRSELQDLGHGLRRLQTRAFDLPVPDRPWTHAYNALHRAFVTVALDDPGFQGWFRDGEPLPQGYGVGLDERVIEYPWLLAQDPKGRVLDAGSVLNHAHILERFRPRFDALTIATLVTEDETFPEHDITYLDADLRELPFDDDSFDTTVCLSTLEHVGMDNTYYGAGEDVAAVAEDPATEARRALAELLRVTRPGGQVLLSVPFGQRERLRWLRILDSADLDDLLSGVPADRRRVEVFRYLPDGWRRATAEEAAGARYRDYMADPAPVDDAAAAARAVACVTITV